MTKKAGWNISLDIDEGQINDRLFLKGFMNQKMKPVAKRALAVLNLEEIIKRYNYIMRGIGNFYFPLVDRLSYLSFIFYFLKCTVREQGLLRDGGSSFIYFCFFLLYKKEKYYNIVIFFFF